MNFPNQSTHQSRFQSRVNSDDFDDMFSFEANIESKLTRPQKQRIARENLLKTASFVDWDKNPDEGLSFFELCASEKLYVVYAQVEGVDHEELLALCRNVAMAGDKCDTFMP